VKIMRKEKGKLMAKDLAYFIVFVLFVWLFL
jgi:hypothetical protein